MSSSSSEDEELSSSLYEGFCVQIASFNNDVFVACRKKACGSNDVFVLGLGRSVANLEIEGRAALLSVVDIDRVRVVSLWEFRRGEES